MAIKQEPNAYLEELKMEMQQTNPSSHSGRLLSQEISRIEKGESKDRAIPWITVHNDQPQHVAVRVRIPVKEHPKYNFVGKLLGPKGASLKQIQEETGTKMSILGKGSMRDKNKEEECRKEGGKFAHLNDELHVLVEVFSEMTDAYGRLSQGLGELKKYLVPEYNDEIRMQQFDMMGYMSNGQPPMRGGPGGGRGVRGAPRGAPRGRGGPPGASPAGRGAPVGRGAPAPRGMSRGMPRGAPAARGRGGVPPREAPVYEDPYSAGQGYEDPYASAGVGSGYGEAEYDQTYGGASDTQYFEYGHGSGGSGAGGYEDYSGGWTSGGGPVKPSAGRGMRARTHPYGAPRGGGGY